MGREELPRLVGTLTKIYEFYCTNNLELQELQKLREQEVKQR